MWLCSLSFQIHVACSLNLVPLPLLKLTNGQPWLFNFYAFSPVLNACVYVRWIGALKICGSISYAALSGWPAARDTPFALPTATSKTPKSKGNVIANGTFSHSPLMMALGSDHLYFRNCCRLCFQFHFCCALLCCVQQANQMRPNKTKLPKLLPHEAVAMAVSTHSRTCTESFKFARSLLPPRTSPCPSRLLELLFSLFLVNFNNYLQAFMCACRGMGVFWSHLNLLSSGLCSCFKRKQALFGIQMQPYQTHNMATLDTSWLTGPPKLPSACWPTSAHPSNK